jgi:hypothetical protein
MWKSERERLRSLLAARLPVPRTPLSVFCFGIDLDALATVANELCLEELIASETISNYRIYTFSDDAVAGDSSATVSKFILHLTLTAFH